MTLCRNMQILRVIVILEWDERLNDYCHPQTMICDAAFFKWLTVLFVSENPVSRAENMEFNVPLS